MNATEFEAMMIRHHAALVAGTLGFEGLLHVVAPTPALLEASMTVARKRKRVLPKVESIDDMLARMG